MDEYKTFIQLNPKLKELDYDSHLPKEISISTITVICKTDFTFNTIAIAKYLNLTEIIKTVKCGNSGEYYRSTDKTEKKVKQKKKLARSKQRNFFNQVSIMLDVPKLLHINVKLFKNGSIQIPGCKLVSATLWGLTKLFEELRLPEFVYDVDENVNMKIHFVDKPSLLYLDHVYRWKIVMINSNFRLGFQINRERLYKNLLKDGYECSLDTSRHAAVKICFKTDSGIGTILVFGKGSIVITGVCNYSQLLECYKFVNVYLIDHYEEIHLHTDTE